MRARLRRGDRNIAVPWNTQREQNRGLCSFSSFWAAFELSANKDVWAGRLLIGEYWENKELILMKAHSECPLKLLKFEMSLFTCDSLTFLFFFFIFNPEGWISSLADWVTQGRLTIPYRRPVCLKLEWSVSIICLVCEQSMAKDVQALILARSEIYSTKHVILFFFLFSFVLPSLFCLVFLQVTISFYIYIYEW